MKLAMKHLPTFGAALALALCAPPAGGLREFGSFGTSSFMASSRGKFQR